MKMKQQHYNTILEAVRPNAPKIAAHRQFIINEGKAKDIDKRLRWDLFRYARLTRWCCDELYPYLNDDHIDTALRSVMRELSA